MSEARLGGAITTTFYTRTNDRLIFSLTAPSANTYSLDLIANDGQSSAYALPIYTGTAECYAFFKDFSSPPPTNTSSLGSVTIKNTGGVSTSSQSISVSPNNGIFTVSSTCISSPIGPKGTCNESVTFTPPVGDPVGTKYSANLTISFSGPLHPSAPSTHTVTVYSSKN